MRIDDRLRNLRRPGPHPSSNETGASAACLLQAEPDRLANVGQWNQHHWMQLHPIMYVPDQYAERDFYRLFGFQDAYDGDEFPGFLAVRNGEAIIGLQAASTTQLPYAAGLRWQFELNTAQELDEIIATCERHSLAYRLITEAGGTRFRTRMAAVHSPSGVEVWFEGPNQA